MHVFVHMFTYRNCELLINPIIDNVIQKQYMDTNGNAVANTRITAQLMRTAVVVSARPTRLARTLFNHDN